MPKASQSEYGEQSRLQSIRRPYLYVMDPARRSRASELMRALAKARRHHISDWLKSWRGKRNPFQEGVPWLSWPCIDYLEKQIRPGMRVFEYGGGGSTIYFLSRGCSVTTVEGHSGWAQAIQDRANELGDAGRNLELRVRDIQSRDPAARAAYVDAISPGGPWDLILIDGGLRLECLSVAIHHVSRDGFLVFDNTDLPEYANAYKLAEGFQRIVFPGLGRGRRSATVTEVFRPIDGQP